MRFSHLFFAEFRTLLCLFFIIFSSLFLKAYVLLFLFFVARRELTTNYVCFYFLVAFQYLLSCIWLILFISLSYLFLSFLLLLNLMVWWVFNILSNCFTLVQILFQILGMICIFVFFFFWWLTGLTNTYNKLGLLLFLSCPSVLYLVYLFHIIIFLFYLFFLFGRFDECLIFSLIVSLWCEFFFKELQWYIFLSLFCGYWFD